MRKYLIDTHVLIWFLEDNSKLPKDISEIIISENERIYISMVSLWEISIKRSIDKLDLKLSTSTIIDRCKKHWNIKNGFTSKELQIYENLPFYHRDPFDRMLIAQAKNENMIIITKDSNFSKYNIEIMW